MEPVMGYILIGIDIARNRDRFAVAVVEAEWRNVGGRQEDHYIVHFLERLPLKMPYDKARMRVAEIYNNLKKQKLHIAALFVDASGQGEIFSDELRAMGIWAVPVILNGSARRTIQADAKVSLGKAWMVSRMKMLLQCGRLHLPKTREGEAMKQELLNYEIRMTEDTGHEQFGAFSVGQHDDLVTAVGLACQEMPPEPLRLLNTDPDWQMESSF